MKNIKFVTLLVFTYTNLIFTQNAPAVLDIINSAPTQEPTTMTSTINLSGNFQELVIPVGFSDYNPSYPQITQNKNYPPLGVFPDGTLLNDFIQQNGPINVEEWYEEGMEHFFSSQSGGDYTVDFTFVKMPNGDVYTPTQSLSDFAGGGSINNVIWNNWEDICNEVTNKVYYDYPAIFNGIDCIHFVFDVGTTPGDAFHTQFAGTIQEDVTFGNDSVNYYTTKPISIQKKLRDLPHERMHIIGSIAGKPSGFEGFPDRGSDFWAQRNDGYGVYHNLQWGYDVMSHNGTLVAQYSLYGLPPLLAHDLIFLGWIDEDEILEINGTNENDLKLADVNYHLTTEQKNNDFYRIVKVMIHENYNADWDEYFLIEYRNATEFDKNFTNYDQGNNYGKGVLIWHIRERTNLINQFSDNVIDLEVAVPYNGWYGNPIPNDSYPRNYTRPTIWNNRAGDSDYLDDLQVEYYSPWDKDVFSYLQDGGRHIWETTDPRTTFNWYPPET